MLAVDTNRPPYLIWGTRPMEDREATEKAGHMVMKDVEVVTIMRPGSKDTLEKLTEVYLREMKEKSIKGEIPATWLPAIQASYQNWKQGEAEPVNGTSIKNWPAVSPAQAQNIIKCGIYTVEDLAAIPDNELQILPIGGLALRQKAQSWLQAATDKGKIAEENAALKAKVADLTATVEKLAADVQKLKPKA